MIDSCGSVHCLLGVNLISDENGITKQATIKQPQYIFNWPVVSNG